MLLRILKKNIKEILAHAPSALFCIAYLWRRMLFRTTFIAITGSHGKTTAKDCLAATLEAKYPTIKTLGTRNSLMNDLLAKTVLKIKPWHRYAVLELGVGEIGNMKRMVRLVKPDIALVLKIGRSHLKEFRTLEGIAKEKVEIIKTLGPAKTAILNGDDPLVAAMAEQTSARVITFGTSRGFDIWVDKISSAWPKRLELHVHSGSDSYPVKTQFVGPHWVPSVVGALAAAYICGIPMEKAVKRIGQTEPYWARLQPIQLPNGAIVIRDEWYGSHDTYDVALRVLETATANRKFMVSTCRMTDTSKGSRDQARYLGRGAAHSADIAVFIGRYSDVAAKAAVLYGMPAENVYTFDNWIQAAEILKRELREGDLLLLKGRTSEHITRLYLNLIGDVKCQLSHCVKLTLCDHCPDLGFKWTQELDGLMARPLGVK